MSGFISLNFKALSTELVQHTRLQYGPLRNPGTDALDERRGLGIFDAAAVGGNFPVHIQGEKDIGILPVEILSVGAIGFGAGGQNHDPVPDERRRW